MVRDTFKVFSFLVVVFLEGSSGDGGGGAKLNAVCETVLLLAELFAEYLAQILGSTSSESSYLSVSAWVSGKKGGTKKGNSPQQE